jgi:hypothetical protein
MRRLLIGALLLAGCAETAVAPVGNQAPTIGLAAADPSERVAPGQAISLTVGATDPDNDGVTYAWSASAGTVSGDGTSQVVWIPPQTTGTAVLRVIVADFQGAASAAYWTLTVTPSGGTLSAPRIVRPVQVPSPTPTPGASAPPSPAPTSMPLPSPSGAEASPTPSPSPS